jgi:hypothetical protein
VTGDPAIEARIRTAQIVAGGLVMGVLTFTAVVVALVVTGAMGSPPAAGLASLPVFGAFGAAVLLVVTPVVRRRILETGPAGDRDTVVGRWFTATIVAMALREGAGILGLALSLVAGSATWAAAFGVASVAAIILSWPRGEDLRERLRRLPS